MKTNRLRAYGSTALGTTALLASHSDAATVVDVNGTTFNTGLSGIGIVGRSGDGSASTISSVTFSSYLAKQTSGYFRRASDATAVSFDETGTSRNFFYANVSSEGVAAPKQGAALNSSDNWFYAASSDKTQRVWLQFQFGGSANGTDFSIVKAVFPETVGELPSAQSAAVPEPSALALLSLGASGLLIRRRKLAA